MPGRRLLWLIGLLVPRAHRARWREEWLAEVEQIARERGWGKACRAGAGAVVDAWTVRRLASHPAVPVRWRPLHAIDQDLRYAARGLLRSPGFALGVTLSLALGIGANTAAFSFINAAVFRHYDHVADQEGLVRVGITDLDPRFGFPLSRLNHADFLLLSEQMDTLQDVSANMEVTLSLSGHGPATAVRGAVSSRNYFEVLGVRPQTGRFFDEGDALGARPVVVISDALWQRPFERQAGALGSEILVNGRHLTIIGVLPPAFSGVNRSNEAPDLVVPMWLGDLALRHRGRPARIETAERVRLDVVGRRRAGAGFEAVSAQAAAISGRLSAERSKPALRVTVSRVWRNDPATMAPAIVGFMATPMLVLAIACVNAANLLYARSHRRSREWAVRVALGAGRWRVLRQVLCESLILAAFAGALGIAVTRIGVAVVARQVPFPMPIDHRVVGFTVALAVFTAVAFSLLPALRVTASAARPASFTASGAFTARPRMRFALVAVQTALSVGLLATGAQFTRTVYASKDDGRVAAPHRLLLASFDVDPVGLDAAAAAQFHDRALTRVRETPGVRQAALVTRGFAMGTITDQMMQHAWVPGGQAEGRTEFVVNVSPGFFETMGIQMLQGRALRGGDAAASQVVVNREFARQRLGGNAIGRTIRLAADSRSSPRDATIVGVASGFLKQTDLEPPLVYHTGPASVTAQTIAVRLDDSGKFDAGTLQAIFTELNPHVALTNVGTLTELRRANPEKRFLMEGVMALGVLALLLAAGGLYSVMAFIVSVRRNELGIRLSLGAAPAAVVRMMVRQGLVPTFIGSVLGATGAAAAGLIIKSRLFGATGPDPLAFGSAMALMVTVMIVATWIPARQAGRIDALMVLRSE